jgi:dUTP pyrophosphatase
MKRIAVFEKVSPAVFAKDRDTYCGGGASEELYGRIKLPRRATGGSAGYDFFLPEDRSLAAGQTIVIPTGIRCKIDEGWVLKIYPRSGLGFKYRIRLDNTVGVIDSDYYHADNEGHIIIKLTNESTDGSRTAELPAGSGFAQGVFCEYGITRDDDATDRRRGGLGSTTT